MLIGEHTAGELAGKFDMARPSVSEQPPRVTGEWPGGGTARRAASLLSRHRSADGGVDRLARSVRALLA
nr:hypothetical protein [Kribbella solani]